MWSPHSRRTRRRTSARTCIATLRKPSSCVAAPCGFCSAKGCFVLGPGDFVRAPPGVRHGFANVSGAEVELLVSFHPGGFEQLFVDHRTDQHPSPPSDGFMEDA